MNEDQLLNTRQVAQLYGLSVPSLKVYVRSGRLPKPVKIPGIRLNFWRRSEIMAHIAGLEHAEKEERIA